MENERKYIVDGYRFENEKDFNLAKEELKRLSDLKKGNDLKEEASLKRMYDAFVEKAEFRTPIGIGFLREAQKRLLQNPENKRTMKAIPVSGVGGSFSVSQDKLKEGIDFGILYERQKVKLRNLRIVLGFMVLIVVVLFAVTIFDRSLTPEKAREQVLNEYASWKEELTSKENELRVREKAILEKEAFWKQSEQKER